MTSGTNNSRCGIERDAGRPAYVLNYRVRLVGTRICRAPVIANWNAQCELTPDVVRVLAGCPLSPVEIVRRGIMDAGAFAACIENNAHHGRALARHRVGRVCFRDLARDVLRFHGMLGAAHDGMEWAQLWQAHDRCLMEIAGRIEAAFAEYESRPLAC